MALFNESLEGRYNQLIQRLHGHKGGPPAPQIAPEIVHVITLENDRFESRFLAQTDSWANSIQGAANATHVSVIGVRNPVGSGALVVIEGLSLVNTLAAAFNADLWLLTSGISNVIVNSQMFNRDRRRAGRSLVQLVADNASFVTEAAYVAANVQASGPVDTLRLAAADDVETFQTFPWVLPPSSELDVVTQLINTGLTVVTWGYSRPLGSMDLLG